MHLVLPARPCPGLPAPQPLQRAAGPYPAARPVPQPVVGGYGVRPAVWTTQHIAPLPLPSRPLAAAPPQAFQPTRHGVICNALHRRRTPAEPARSPAELQFLQATVDRSHRDHRGPARLDQLLGWHSNLVYLLSQQAAGEQTDPKKAGAIRAPHVQSALQGSTLVAHTGARQYGPTAQKLATFLTEPRQQHALIDALEVRRAAVDRTLQQARRAQAAAPSADGRAHAMSCLGERGLLDAQIEQVRSLVRFARDPRPFLQHCGLELQQQVQAGQIALHRAQSVQQKLLNFQHALMTPGLREIGGPPPPPQQPQPPRQRQHRAH